MRTATGPRGCIGSPSTCGATDPRPTPEPKPGKTEDTLDLSGFVDLWEHVRLLSDAPRNQALLTLLQRRSPGARVCEVGCGSGLLSCIAARMGAQKVYAIEPTALHHNARALVRANNLQDIVEVLEGQIQDVAPPSGGVDLVFSELLNADPLVEGVLEAMDAAAGWAAPTGRIAPRRLKLCVAVLRENSSAREVLNTRAQLDSLSQKWDLDLGPLRSSLQELGAYRYMSPLIAPVSDAAAWFDAPLGQAHAPPDEQIVSVTVQQAGPIAGAAVWFEAEMDDGLVMHNRPGHPGHWGHLVCGWPEERGARAGETVSLCVRLDDDGVDVSLA